MSHEDSVSVILVLPLSSFLISPGCLLAVASLQSWVETPTHMWVAASQGGGVMVTSHGDRSYNLMNTMISAVAAFWVEIDKELISKHRFLLVNTH